MELQLALLLAGIIAFSDSARGKETALAAHAATRARLSAPQCPRRDPQRELLSVRTRPMHELICAGVQARAHVLYLLYLCVLGPSLWMERGCSGFAAVS